jgi:hypothetical protein
MREQYMRKGEGFIVSFIGGGNWSTGIKPKTCCKSLINFIT